MSDRDDRMNRSAPRPRPPGPPGGGARNSFRHRARAVKGAAVALLAAAASPGAAVAAASPWFAHDHGAVRLIAAGAATGTADAAALGLQFRMEPGWKIYWRSPGDAGFPPRLDWTGSDNLAAARISWPAPKRFSVAGLETLGYEDEVVLPIEASLRAPGEALALKARLRFLTCDDVCVPYETDLALRLPAGPGADAPEAAAIARWRARVPRPDAGGPLEIARAEVAGRGEDRALVVKAASADGFERPDLYVEGPPGVGFAKPEVRLAAAGREALMRIGVHGGGAGLAGAALTLTLVDGDRALERRMVAGAAAALPPDPAPGRDRGLLAILGLALLGGLILNLMPCVLPVLSMKLMTVIGHGGAAPARVRAGFLASAAGILACFAVLGTAVAGLKAAGLAVGWGIQFQQPAFLAFMVVVLALFACATWGLFDVRLPGALAGAAARAGGDGQGLRGHFLAGAFATLLATPCTAPFLGTAVGFALARGPAEIYAVFAALGLGLAAPWLAVAARPALVSRLPRPGAWMVSVRRVLAFALAATAAWLLGLLWLQVGGAAVVMIALLAAAVPFVVRQGRSLGDGGRRAAWGLGGLLAAGAMAGAVGFSGSGGERAAAADGGWRVFDERAVAAEVAAGRTALVDVTADWCLTCQVNKSLVLDRGRVARLVADGGIAGFRADWTLPDPGIAAYLRRFGRYGIPFNAVYGPAAPGGLPLPEILTEAEVLEAAARAGAGARPAARAGAR